MFFFVLCENNACGMIASCVPDCPLVTPPPSSDVPRYVTLLRRRVPSEALSHPVCSGVAAARIQPGPAHADERDAAAHTCRTAPQAASSVYGLHDRRSAPLAPPPLHPFPPLSLSPSLTRRSGARRVSVSDSRVCQRHRVVSSSRPQSRPVCKSLPVAAVRRAPANADFRKGIFALNQIMAC